MTLDIAANVCTSCDMPHEGPGTVCSACTRLLRAVVGPSPVAVARDRLAAWLTEAEPIISAMFERKDPAFKEAWAVWSEKLADYEHFCTLEPEVPS